MNLSTEINALAVDLLYARGTIPCARLGRKVRETECCSQVLAADPTAFRVCLACPQGHKLAARTKIAPRNLLPLAIPVAASPAGAHVRKAAPVAKPAAEAKPKTPRAKRQAKPVSKPAPAPMAERVITTAEPALPNCPCVDPRLAKLASALRELTADGRMRVSMLDLMRGVGASNYDEAASLVLFAGLRMSQLHGPVQAVLVDHNARLFMEGAASEVRQ